ncbi:MAG: pitrilysin family protein [Tidjanibacter sp.]|nr:pitrilysin family protein [Tidjanibacter sp.]
MKEEFFIYTLPNGIRGVLKQVKSPVVYSAMTIGTGTRDELAGQFGMAHLVEHTIFKGTERRMAYQVNCRLENLGGELNAFTTKEETVVHTTALRCDFNKSAELMADIIFHSTFPQNEVDKEKEVIYDEINLYKDSPPDRIYDDFEDLIFEGSELGHNILGRKSTLARMTSDDIRRFIDRTFDTHRMVFTAIGNLSPKSFSAAMVRYFGSVPETTVNRCRRVPQVVAPFNHTIGRATHQIHSMWGCRAYSLAEEDRLPMILLSNILGGPSAASRLNVAMRERNALSYTVETSYTPFTDCGIFSVYFSCEKDKLERCNEVLSEELDKICRVPLSARQLSVAKRQFMGQFAISSESNENYMLGTGKSFLVYGTIDPIDEIFDKVRQTSADDIMRTARDVLHDFSVLTFR